MIPVLVNFYLLLDPNQYESKWIRILKTSSELVFNRVSDLDLDPHSIRISVPVVLGSGSAF